VLAGEVAGGGARELAGAGEQLSVHGAQVRVVGQIMALSSFGQNYWPPFAMVLFLRGVCFRVLGVMPSEF
jgi:hypothetical protein